MSDKATYVIDRILHWMSSLLIVAMLSVMGTQVHNVDYRIKGPIAHKQEAIEVHIIMAIVLLILLLSRIVWSKWFLANSYKPQLRSLNHKWLVRSVHGLMYLMLFSLMISGLFMVNNYEHPLHVLSLLSFSQVNTEQSIFYAANNVHLFIKSALYLLIALHVAGVIYSKK